MGNLFNKPEKVKRANIDLMTAERGYDVTIVCTGDAKQAAFWMAKLDEGKGKSVPTKSTVVAVDEDWSGGAGNFLGTLYAWQKACKVLKAKGRDLPAELASGASVALFHTAGKGTRLAPVPGGENNNKPGVKLPVPDGSSILESVIRQTGAYAKSRSGRLSVFWGDQIFVPSISVEYTAKHHADIACALGPMPTEADWEKRGLSSYGCIAATADNTVRRQLEKVKHGEAVESLKGATDVSRVGPSLGSFSLSADFLAALETGFGKELSKKKGKMDSDPHLWMAMTLTEDEYAALAVKKELFSEAEAKAHHKRVADLVASFDAKGLGMFGAVDVGMDMSWWDFGMLKLYRQNALLITENSKDAALARHFFGVTEYARTKDSNLGTCKADRISVVSNTTAKSGSITASAVSNVCCNELVADGAVLVGVYAKKITAAKGSIAYNVVDDSDKGIVLAENEVRVGVHTIKSYFEMKSDVNETDGGKVFKTKVHGNSYSFQEVYDMNQGTDVSACAVKAKAAMEALRGKL